MNLTGIWKPYGKYAQKDKKIIIQDQELTYWPCFASPTPKQATVHFHLAEERRLRENHSYNIVIDEKQYKDADFMVHEEIIDGNPVVILSNTCMEYDGRGRIVIASYVREEDYSLVNDEFKSLAYQYLNECPSVPMMQPDLAAGCSMAMMSAMAGMPGMAGTMPGMTAPATNPSTPVEPWDCACGKKQNTTKYCPECGKPVTR